MVPENRPPPRARGGRCRPRRRMAVRTWLARSSSPRPPRRAPPRRPAPRGRGPPGRGPRCRPGVRRRVRGRTASRRECRRATTAGGRPREGPWPLRGRRRRCVATRSASRPMSVAAALVAQQRPPAAHAGGAPVARAAQADGAGAADERDAPALGRAARQDQLDVVHHEELTERSLLLHPAPRPRPRPPGRPLPPSRSRRRRCARWPRCRAAAGPRTG